MYLPKCYLIVYILLLSNTGTADLLNGINYLPLGLDSIRTAILNWHFLRIDTQEMHIPSAISILGTDLRGLIP